MSSSFDVSTLNELEVAYHSELRATGKASIDTKFAFSMALVQSSNKTDIERGVGYLLEMLAESTASQSALSDEFNREYYYFISTGYFKLRNFEQAQRYVRMLLVKEPKNRQALDLCSRIQRQKREEKLMVGIAATVGTVSVALLTGLLLSRKR